MLDTSGLASDFSGQRRTSRYKPIGGGDRVSIGGTGDSSSGSGSGSDYMLNGSVFN